MEISKDEVSNPIKHSVSGKKGRLQYVRNCFPHHGYMWNYGSLPQTWEDDSTPSGAICTSEPGVTGDLLDVCEISNSPAYIGQIKCVKVLGIMGVLQPPSLSSYEPIIQDSSVASELPISFKIIAIDITDDLAEKLHNIDDVEKWCPGIMSGTKEWFRYA
ncbi:hypothetical protein PHLCEN_2v9231 [Hermanssonia centrifuga]|uniref:inorganic diphosphatase n=1 Tax=Hermanssonia centrifuga TaxID=98765 RepID=A0A2R6NRD2_9APHY|nr:hypothetical protein PHLCEN_2v9231 [Hermanssonia centrifuga]